MGGIKEPQSGHEYKVAVFPGRILKIYDGKGRSSDISQERSFPRKPFVDRVMEEVGDSVPFRVIDGGLSADNTQESNTETVIEYVGPKRLPRITVVKKQTEPQDE